MVFEKKTYTDQYWRVVLKHEWNADFFHHYDGDDRGIDTTWSRST
jgi:hypothetical protein